MVMLHFKIEKKTDKKIVEYLATWKRNYLKGN